jgi:type II secretory ATPase GspE/PulE/Tfp pilus assembly ATPase PilB-like protein
MPTITATIQMGFYISPVKLIFFILGLLGWLPLLKWINQDAVKVKTNVQYWTAAIFTAGAAGLVVWLMIPLFIIGLPMYIIAVGATAVVYIMHRNSLVTEFQKVLTKEHIKSLFVDEQKQADKMTKGLVFITANKNKVPIPMVKTPEFSGYKTSQEFFDDAITRRAEDISLSPADKQYNILYVIDGSAEKQQPRSREETEYFIHYLKNLADLDIEEHRKPQTGTFSVLKDGKPYKWEVSTAGTTVGEQVRLKFVAEFGFKMLPDLGLMPDQLEKFKNIANGPKGLFLITGTKKSGVTTTFYSLLRNHDPFLNNINSLEKHPAGEVPSITQNVFTLSDTGTTTYGKKFQSILRTGPDIIGVEHSEEKDVAKLACSAAKDGKMTYATFEATSAIDALAKWLGFVGDRSLAIDYLVGISNQRLVRKLCEQCRQPYEPNKELLRKHNIPADKIKAFYRPGEIQHTKHNKPIVCPHCQGTGFFGRMAIFEMIILDDETKKLLKQAKSLNDISSIFRRARMLYLQEQAIRKVAEGVTSINEVIRTLSGPGENAKKPPAKS